MKKITLHTFCKKLALVATIALVICYLFFTGTRYFSSYLNHYRPDFEKWTSEFLHAPVHIEHVSLTWYHYQPVITLHQMRIFNADNREPILEIQKIRLFFSIIHSIWQWQPVLNGAQLSGAAVTIYENQTHEWRVKGFPSLAGFKQTPFSQETKFSTVLHYLASPKLLLLRNIDVLYINAKQKQRRVLLYETTLKNDTDQHFIYGKAVLQQQLPTDLTLAIRWQGDISDLTTLQAKAYFYVSGLSLSEWLKDSTWYDWQIKSGLTSAKIWFTWNKQQIQSLQSQLQIYDLIFNNTTTQDQQTISRISGNVMLQQQDKQIIITGSDLLVDWPDHLWPTNYFNLVLTKPAEDELALRSIKVGYFDLVDLQKILPYLKQHLSATTLSTFNALQLSGHIQNFALTLPRENQAWWQASVQADVYNLSTQPIRHWPGIENVNFKLAWEGQYGKININSQRSIAHAPSIFSQRIPIKQVHGDVNIEHKEPGWEFTTQSLQIVNDAMQGAIKGVLSLNEAYEPIADLHANFTLPKLTELKYYLPIKLFSLELNTWLKRAFLAGSITEATLHLQGPLLAFPFDQKQGRFNLSAQIEEAALQYDSDWPTINAINGKINFEGRALHFNVPYAEIMHIPLQDVQATIPYIGNDKPQTLMLSSAPIQYDLQQGIQFLQQTPLRKPLSKVIKHLLLSGPSKLDLQLTIPLKHPQQTKVQGKTTFDDASLILMPTELSLHKIKGELVFTEKTLMADAIKAMFFKRPFTLQIHTQEQKQNGTIIAEFTTQLATQDLQNWFKLPLEQWVQGQTSIEGKVKLIENQPAVVLVKSNLLGITIRIPNLEKKADQTRPLTANLVLNESAPLQAKFDYNQQIKSALTLVPNKKTFSLASLVVHVGPGDVNYAEENGWFFTGYVKNLSVDQLQTYTTQKSHSLIDLTKLKNIDLKIGLLTLGNQNFANVNTSAIVNANKDWLVQLKSEQIAGQVTLPVNFQHSQQPIIIRLTQLHLSNIDTQNKNIKTMTLDVKSLPALDFKSEDVNYDGRSLGAISFITRPNNNGLTIQSLQITSPRMLLTAAGSWSQQKNKPTTHLSGTLRSQQLTELIRSLRLDNHNFVAKTGKLTFNFNWPDAPYHLDLATLNGTVNLDIGQGQVTDIGQESNTKMNIGRMLSVFSLQTLPRRLSLDFSDLLQKGYSFDSIKGDFNFAKGNAQTDNLQFDGPVAKVRITGRIGFKLRDFDLQIRITPYVTSSLPVAAALVTVQPLVGVAAWVVNKAIGSQVSKATTYTYAVTGPWDDPQWKTI